MTATPAINAALKLRYPLPEWALMFQVANGTGATQRRFADALAMNLFPSRGLELHGFEIKVSRGDWQREIADPKKAEEIAQFCDRWWIVASKEIVRKDELPAGWGLIEFDGKGLRQVVQAPRFEGVQPLTRSFIAAMLRRSTEIDHAMVGALVNQKVAEIRERDLVEIESRVAERTRDRSGKLAAIAAIEKQAGISLTDWDADDSIGRCIKAIRASGLATQWRGLRGLALSLRSITEQLDKHVAEFDAIAPRVEDAPIELAKRQRRA